MQASFFFFFASQFFEVSAHLPSQSQEEKTITFLFHIEISPLLSLPPLPIPSHTWPRPCQQQVRGRQKPGQAEEAWAASRLWCLQSTKDPGLRIRSSPATSDRGYKRKSGTRGKPCRQEHWADHISPHRETQYDWGWGRYVQEKQVSGPHFHPHLLIYPCPQGWS